jgi:hypothetical protein
MATSGRSPAATHPRPYGLTLWPSLIRELALVTALFLLYRCGRLLAVGHTGEAFRHAAGIWRLERWAHLPSETGLQQLLLHSETLVRAANTFYATVHFPATALFLIWMYVRRAEHYAWARRVLTAMTAAALLLHLLYPLAPPRLLPGTGLVDTAQVYGPSAYGGDPATDTTANQFAAMPSLHFGWALMIAVGMIIVTSGRWRWLWLLHPLITLVVITGTANHYWLDSLVGGALLALALWLVPSAGHAHPALIAKRKA